ncbi:MAG: fatty acyl-AMP ligase [Myxococcales bacterium FL481]|nr:MAG: fatty acyl-AMP ligase [Myxococcales bacterium FL481]
MGEIGLLETIERCLWSAPSGPRLVIWQDGGAPTELSAAQILTEVRVASERLVEQGVTRGELVVVLMRDLAASIVAFFAVMAAGGLPTLRPCPVRWRTDRSVRSFVSRVQPCVVLTSGEHAGPARAALDELECRVIGFDELGPEATTAFGSARAWGTKSAPVQGSTAFVQFTSGSTGRPKGVALSDAAVLAQIRHFSTALPFDERSVNVSALPLFHDMGLVTQVLMPFVCGAQSVVLDPKHWVRRPVRLLQAVSRYRGTMTWMPNFAFRHCVRGIRKSDLDGIDLSSWSVVGNGSEPIDIAAMADFERFLAGAGLRATALRTGYGLAETVLSATVSRPGTPLRTSRPGGLESPPGASDGGTGGRRTEFVSCGAPIPGVEIRVVDPAGRDRPRAEVGEILVRSASMFHGYYGEPPSASQRLRGGWLHTGDLGYLCDGELFVCGRINDVIVTGGRKFCPESMECEISRVAGDEVAGAVVFGLYDARIGTQAVVAVLERARRLGETERTHLERRVRVRVMEAFDVGLRSIEIVRRGWICRTSSRKVARARSRTRYLEQFGRVRNGPALDLPYQPQS